MLQFFFFYLIEHKLISIPKYTGEPGTKIAIDIQTDRQNSSKKATKEKLNVNIMLSGDITSQI